MNYRCGFFRAWIVLAVIWIAWVGSIEASGVIESDSFLPPIQSGALVQYRPPAEFVTLLTIIPLPPIGGGCRSGGGVDSCRVSLWRAQWRCVGKRLSGSAGRPQRSPRRTHADPCGSN